MKFADAALAALLTGLALAAPSWSQSAFSGGGALNAQNNHMGSAMSQEQFNQLSEYADRAKRLTKEDKAKGKKLADVLAEDRAAAASLVKALPLNCEVTDAIRAAAGPETVNGKTVETTTYEVSCANGMGYFLVSQEPEKPYGFSCFAADATRQADIKAGRKPGTTCFLPANSDVKALAGNLLSKAGTSCALKEFRYLGQSAASHTEFIEYACEDGKGYISIAALPGSISPVKVESCSQSAARGLPCKMSDNGPPQVTLKTFRDKLAEKLIACDATDKTTHVIGQIAAKKIYVVEFQCSQHPKGLVAYIPQEGSLAPFESLDCPAAAQRGAICTLPGNK